MSSDSQSRVPYSHRRSVQSLLKNKFLGLFQYHCFNAIFEKIIFFGCTGSPLLCVGFLWLWPAGVTLHCDVQASHCGGFLLRSTGSRRTDFSSCSSQALELRVVVVCRLGCSVACGIFPFSSVQFSSVVQLCPTLCDPMNCSTPGLLVHHHLTEFTKTHVH